MCKLMPCPFCGGEADIKPDYEGQDLLDEVWVIFCNTCPCKMVGERVEFSSESFPDEREYLIDHWNNRNE